MAPDKKVNASDLYQSYRKWAKQNGTPPLNNKRFGIEMWRQFPSVERKRETVHPRPWQYLGIRYTGPESVSVW